mmetsp:Transcript_30475/g.68784  ORF Transcript_30475/g.68784 Transcript_30475/m.68784 type:complete len:217 (+) Transcript_30475:93-743(+)
MGQCCSFFARLLPRGDDGFDESTNHGGICSSEPTHAVQSHSINRAMSAPSLSFTADDQAKGCGLALIDCPVEQDRAYWEWHIDETASQQGSLIMFGVSNKRNQKFYEILGESSIPAEKHGTKFLAGVEGLKEGDVVGVAVQQSRRVARVYPNFEDHASPRSTFQTPGSHFCTEKINYAAGRQVGTRSLRKGLLCEGANQSGPKHVMNLVNDLSTLL